MVLWPKDEEDVLILSLLSAPADEAFSVCFNVENDIPSRKTLNTIFFWLKSKPNTAAVWFQVKSEGTMQIWCDFVPVLRSEWLMRPTVYNKVGLAFESEVDVTV